MFDTQPLALDPHKSMNLKYKRLKFAEVPELLSSLDAFNYAKCSGQRRPDLERIILTDPSDPYFAVDYARDVIKGRWIKAEPVIAQDQAAAYQYGLTVLQGKRNKVIERSICTNPKLAYKYAYNVIGGRFQMAEAYIIKDPIYAAYYASDVLKWRWPEAEDTIAKDAHAAFLYTANVVKCRWKKGEKSILHNLETALSYAKDVLKSKRLDVLEEVMATNSGYAYRYAVHVLHGRFEAGERTIAQCPHTALDYAKNVIKGRWIKGETAIATDRVYALEYTSHIKQRFIKAEKLLSKDPLDVHAYNQLLASLEEAAKKASLRAPYIPSERTSLATPPQRKSGPPRRSI